MQVGLALKQQMRVSPQLVMTSRLLTLSYSALEQVVEAELLQNPALERVRCDARPWVGGGYNPDPEAILRTAAAPISIQDQLITQARLAVDRKEWQVIEWLIGSLDSHGYLRKAPEVLAAELGLPLGIVERGLKSLREMDPPGLGARDLRDCLLLQCDRGSKAVGYEVARRMLIETWEEFSQQRWGRVARRLGLTTAEVDDGRRFIRRYLYPYPLLLLDNPVAQVGFGPADLIIHQEDRDGEIAYIVEVPGVEEFELRISDSFELALQTIGKASPTPDEQNWIASRVEGARLFIASLKQRWTTLRQIGEYVVHYQHAYLEGGPLHLQPLTRVSVARELGLHESTVSRAIQSKTIQLPDGRIVPLKELFNHSAGPKEAIRRLLASKTEMSDRDVAERLQGSGLNLSRRTVAKYRAQLNIPSSIGR
jgi:RNA polymerase sigma-54 factor